jgi:hypothetical protein
MMLAVASIGARRPDAEVALGAIAGESTATALNPAVAARRRRRAVGRSMCSQATRAA